MDFCDNRFEYYLFVLKCIVSFELSNTLKVSFADQIVDLKRSSENISSVERNENEFKYEQNLKHEQLMKLYEKSVNNFYKQFTPEETCDHAITNLET